MIFKFPNLDGVEVDIPIDTGQVIFIIGANGSGKSSLAHKLFTTNQAIARWISAHRQTWFMSNAMDLTAAAKKQTQENIKNRDINAESRWSDRHAQQRSSITIFELIESENIRAREIAAAADDGNLDEVAKLALKDAPLAVLNELLAGANLPIKISIGKDQQVFAKKNDSDFFSIAELSDGERNAVLIAADVLTAAAGTLMIIDEPERHLHRSIVSPLLLSLFEMREDCGFIILTHDVSLPVDSPEVRTLIVRSCAWAGNVSSGWDTDLLEPAATISEDVRLAILGARRKILFVEGDRSSLDQHIYSILFPTLSVSPSGNCVDVERAVTGIRNAEGLHWVSAFGLIDRDDRTDDDVNGLSVRGIYALECYSVESLYYCDNIMQKIANRQAQVAEDLADIGAARQGILDCVMPEKQRLCARLVARRARLAVTKNLPTYQSLQENPIHTATFDATGLIAAEEATFDEYVVAGSTDEIVNRYPVRETGAFGRVATSLGFKSRANYESAVRKLLTEEVEARNEVRQMLAALTAAIEA